MRTRLGLVLLATLAVLFPAAAEPPKLAVLVVFDQMRGDYLARWQELYGSDGFRRLEMEGAWFANCHYPYAMTATGPGHASILSGCSAERHGIVANNWYDRQQAAAVYCATAPRYERVPPVPKTVPVSFEKADDKKEADPFEPKAKGFGAPVRMLAPTLGDVIKSATAGKAKVIGLSLKDRSALLPCGQKPDGCYWFDRGQFVTSTYYRDRLHPWVTKFNDEKVSDRWFGQTWRRLRPDLDYIKYSGPDDVVGEGKGFNQGRVFPHPMGQQAEIGSEYYAALACSPFGNELLLELARRAVVDEKLGQRDVPDLLVISFSSNDLIGHAWGPDSQEVLDVTLRSDLIVRDLLRFLDQHVGKGRYALALTADHGVCPIPEVSQQAGRPAARLTPLGLFSAAEKHLSEKFAAGTEDTTRWIEAANEGGVYLNQRAITARGLKVDDVANELAAWLAQQPGLLTAYTRSRLLGQIPVTDEIGRRVQKSFHPDRSGDVLVVPRPYHFVVSLKAGTTHGSPHPYDTHVPLLAFGPGVRGGRRDDAVTPQAAAAILAKMLGVPTPAKAEATVPVGLFGP
ncbi:MAG: alkaline phosphatase family protein [Gemmataceae bacterium]